MQPAGQGWYEFCRVSREGSLSTCRRPYLDGPGTNFLSVGRCRFLQTQAESCCSCRLCGCYICIMYAWAALDQDAIQSCGSSKPAAAKLHNKQTLLHQQPAAWGHQWLPLARLINWRCRDNDCHCFCHSCCLTHTVPLWLQAATPLPHHLQQGHIHLGRTAGRSVTVTVSLGRQEGDT